MRNANNKDARDVIRTVMSILGIFSLLWVCGTHQARRTARVHVSPGPPEGRPRTGADSGCRPRATFLFPLGRPGTAFLRRWPTPTKPWGSGGAWLLHPRGPALRGQATGVLWTCTGEARDGQGAEAGSGKGMVPLVSTLHSDEGPCRERQRMARLPDSASCRRGRPEVRPFAPENQGRDNTGKAPGSRPPATGGRVGSRC